MATGGEIAQRAVAERATRGERAGEGAAGAADERAAEEAGRWIGLAVDAIAAGEAEVEVAGAVDGARTGVGKGGTVAHIDHDRTVVADDGGEGAGRDSGEVAGVVARGDLAARGKGDRPDEGLRTAIERARDTGVVGPAADRGAGAEPTADIYR